MRPLKRSWDNLQLPGYLKTRSSLHLKTEQLHSSAGSAEPGSCTYTATGCWKYRSLFQCIPAQESITCLKVTQLRIAQHSAGAVLSPGVPPTLVGDSVAALRQPLLWHTRVSSARSQGFATPRCKWEGWGGGGKFPLQHCPCTSRTIGRSLALMKLLFFLWQLFVTLIYRPHLKQPFTGTAWFPLRLVPCVIIS